MPRDGSNIYSQPFPDVASDTTIESTVYNGFVADSLPISTRRDRSLPAVPVPPMPMLAVNLSAEKARRSLPTTTIMSGCREVPLCDQRDQPAGGAACVCWNRIHQ